MSDHYRVEKDQSGCKHCNRGISWTIVETQAGESVAIGTSWEDLECAQDICDLMNMAFDAGLEVACAPK